MEKHIKVDEQTHKKIKVESAKREKSMKKFISDIVEDYLKSLTQD